MLACVVLRCGVSVWIVAKLLRSALGVLWDCIGFALDCIGFALGVFGIVEVL